MSTFFNCSSGSRYPCGSLSYFKGIDGPRTATTDYLPTFCVCEPELARSTRQRRWKQHVRAPATDDAHEPLRTLRESHELVPMRLQDAFFLHCEDTDFSNSNVS